MPDIIKPQLLGPDGRPVVKARDRLAPKPSIGAGLEGWVSWRLVDRRGREVQGGEQHNLILDSFLDDIAGNTVDGGFAALATFLSHFAVGTDSTAPSASDTALGNEVGRTATAVASDASRPSAGVHELWVEREFDFAVGNGNLTEFGFAGGVSAGMRVRELFRDGGTPVTVTKTSDYKLRIKYTLTVTLLPVSLTSASFGITGIGTVNGDIMFFGGPDPYQAFYGAWDLRVVAAVARGQLATAGTNLNTVVASAMTPTAASAANAYTAAVNVNKNPDAGSNRSAHATSVTASSYTPGSHVRSFAAEWSTSAANGTIAGIAAAAPTSASNSTAGFAFLIDSGDRFTKDSLHTLAIDDVVTVSWGRA